MIVEILLYYTFFASAVLLYGVGLNKSSDFQIETRHKVIFLTKTIISVISTTVLCYLITDKILMKLGIAEIFPFIALLVFACVSVFCESMIRIACRISSSEYTISFLIVIIAVTESTSLVESILIDFACIFSVALMYFVSYILRTRLERKGKISNDEFFTVFFAFLAVLLVAVAAFDVSWLNLEVFKW